MSGDDGKLKGSKSTERHSIPMSSPLYLHPSDNPNLTLTQILFNGDNYELWADAVKNGLDAKNKLGFLDGTVKKPEEIKGDDNIELLAWRQCNAMLKAWLRNVIDIKLHPSITFSLTFAQIWEELKGRYSVGNAPRVHQLKGELNECNQGRQSVVEYYTRLKTIWDELENYSRVSKCTCGAAAQIGKEQEEEKVHQFFMGLDNGLYGHIRTNLLMEDPIRSLTRAYALVLREERHTNVTKIKEERNEAAMAVKSFGAGRGKGSFAKQDADEDDRPPQCTHCGKYYHTEDNCYDKHGYEVVKSRERGRGRQGGSNTRGNYGRGRGRSGGRGGQQNIFQANAVGNSSGTKEGDATKQNLPFTADEIERIRTLLNPSPTGSHELTGPVYEDGYWTG
ncbi:uncharacterized protein LOC141658518 [Silene latifolia]|uniref:uncharacterized protein LOC141658518 n=1 Tax=Silene latifolia TaxID=37657 RepID=UPI003D76A5CB